MSHCKDPYEPISRMHCHNGFERCSNAPPSCNEAVWKDNHHLSQKTDSFHPCAEVPPDCAANIRISVFGGPNGEVWRCSKKIVELMNMREIHVCRFASNKNTFKDS